VGGLVPPAAFAAVLEQGGMMNLDQALQEISAAPSLEALHTLKVQYLGKNGLVTQEMKTLGKLSPEERKEKGRALNEIKEKLTAALAAR